MSRSASVTRCWWRKDLVGDEPFAVILGDDVIDAKPPALRQMIDVYEQVQGPVIAVERVPPEDVSSYGIVEVDDERRLGPRRLPDHATSWRSPASRMRRRTSRSSAATS